MKPYEKFLHLVFKDLDPGPFPLRFAVEATNHCNLHCTSCPRETSGRGFGHMDRDLFADLARQSAHRDILFYPQGLGESFLHPRFPELLRVMRDEGVRCPIVITNGTLLDEANCRLLLEAQVPYVLVSIDGADPAVFETLRPKASYDEVVANTQRLLRLRDEQGSETPNVILSVLGTDEVRASMDAFEALWRPLLREADDIFTCSPVSWAGAMPHLSAAKPASPGERTPCRMLYKTLSVYFDGRATPCCYDHGCALEVGNARDRSIEEIWNGAPLRELRARHEAGDFDAIPLCAGCPDSMP